MLITLLVLFGALLLLNDGICVASENITNDITLINTTNTTSDLNTTAEQDTLAAGETTPDSTTTTLKEQYNNSHGIWIRSDDIAQINVTALVNAGITDVYVKVSRLVDYQTTLDNLADVKEKLSSSGIRIHAWVTCFKDANGNWVDPLGTYSYTVQVPYQQTVKVSYKQWYKGWYKKYYTKWAKKWYKSWYKYRGKWRYKWKYKWAQKSKYKWKYGWIYRKETRWGTKNVLT